MNNLIITQTFQSSPFYNHCPIVPDLPYNWRQFKLADFPFKVGRLWCFQRNVWIALLDHDDLIISSVFSEAAAIAKDNPNTYGSRLEEYIVSNNPKDTYDVERLTREFDEKQQQKFL